MKIKPDPNCKSCRGTGEVNDFVPVPFGVGNCAMPSLCSCIEEQIPEGYEDEEIEIDLSEVNDARIQT